jgi:hypothetical protein
MGPNVASSARKIVLHKRGGNVGTSKKYGQLKERRNWRNIFLFEGFKMVQD